MRILMTITFFAFFALTGPILAIAKTPVPQAGDVMLVIAQDATNVVRQAGGRLVGPTQAPLAVLAIGDHEFAAQLYASGAWVVTDGDWIAQICGVTQA